MGDGDSLHNEASSFLFLSVKLENCGFSIKVTHFALRTIAYNLSISYDDFRFRIIIKFITRFLWIFWFFTEITRTAQWFYFIVSPLTASSFLIFISFYYVYLLKDVTWKFFRVFFEKKIYTVKSISIIELLARFYFEKQNFLSIRGARRIYHTYLFLKSFSSNFLLLFINFKVLLLLPSVVFKKVLFDIVFSWSYIVLLCTTRLQKFYGLNFSIAKWFKNTLKNLLVCAKSALASLVFTISYLLLVLHFLIQFVNKGYVDSKEAK